MEHDVVRKRPRNDHDANPALSSQRSSQSTTDEATLIRKLTVVFGPLAPVSSLDYIVTEAGISTLPPDSDPDITRTHTQASPPFQPATQGTLPSSLSGGILADTTLTTPSDPDNLLETDPEDEFDDLWKSDAQFFDQLDYATLDGQLDPATLDAAAAQPSSQPSSDVPDFIPSSQLEADGLL